MTNRTAWLKITGPICARAPNPQPRNELSLRGHHDWPVKSDNRRSSQFKWTVSAEELQSDRRSVPVRVNDFETGTHEI